MARSGIDDVIRIDRRLPPRIHPPVRAPRPRVADIQRAFVRGEAQAGGAVEPVRHDAHVARSGVEAVHVLRQGGFGAEAVSVAGGRVGEPEAVVRVRDDGVRGVEGARVEVRE